MRTLLVLALFLSVSSTAPAAKGQTADEHRHTDGHAHGQVHFPTTCQPKTQPVFDRGVALLHSFGYEASRRAFEEVAAQDPTCGIAWWGVAMTYFHQLWDQPTPTELAAGRAAAEKAEAVGARSDREKGYIRAIAAFYRDAGTADHRTRAAAYRDAMEKLAAEHSSDSEAAIFYALSLLAARSGSDPGFATEKRAAEILNGQLRAHPSHPGIAHYTIHAFDYPELAHLALPAARAYAKLAPAVPHALHMPSHIFTRMGLWDESIASNLDVARVAKQEVARTHPGAVAFEHMHASDYLVYAYLQKGDEASARRVVNEVAAAKKFDDANFAAAYALASAPARFALERRQWKEASALKPPVAEGLVWSNYPYARGNTYYANAIGAARSGDPARARQAIAELEKIRSALAGLPRGPYDWAGRLEAMRLASEGWLAYAEGRKEEAPGLLRQAAELEEKVGKHPVTPGAVLPAREQLADLLLALGRPQEALTEYEAVLAKAPKRLQAISGAARAAGLAGNRELEQKYRQELPANTSMRR